MTGLPARLDHWASRIRNPEHLPGGDVRHDGFTDAEAMELSTLLTEAANEILLAARPRTFACHCNFCGTDFDSTDMITNICPDCRTIAQRAYDAALAQIKANR